MKCKTTAPAADATAAQPSMQCKRITIMESETWSPGAPVEISQCINTLALETHTNSGEIKAGGRRKIHSSGEQHKDKKEGVKYI